MSRTRRTGVRLALIVTLLASGGLGACAGADRPTTLTILAPWAEDQQFDPNAADEAAAFRKVLDRFTRETGVQITYQGTRDVSQVLLSGVERGTPPDVAVLPRLNDLMRHARRGAALPLTGADHADAQEPQLIQFDVGQGRQVYGVSITTRVKSLVWYNPDAVPFPAPRTWQQLVNLVDDIDGWGTGVPWCMGMASPPLSGWPGTDWIEDILLHQAGADTYAQWAAGKVPWTDRVVRDAWLEWQRLAPPGRRTETALLTGFWDAGHAMFDSPPGCYLDHQASFIYASYRASWADDRSSPAPRVDFFPFPNDERRLRSGDRLIEVSDNVAGVFTASPQARELVNYLGSHRAQQTWRGASDDLLFSLRDDVDQDDRDDEIGAKIAQTVANGTVCRDASDLMPAAMTTAFQRAVLEYVDRPGRLDDLLNQLENVRAGIPPADWLELDCTEVGQP